MLVSRRLWNRVEKIPLTLWLFWLLAAFVGLCFSLGCAEPAAVVEPIDETSTVDWSFWVTTDTESTLESPAPSTPVPSAYLPIGGGSRRSTAADGPSPLPFPFGNGSRREPEGMTMTFRNIADGNSSRVGSTRFRREAGAKDKEAADVTSTVVPSLEAPGEAGSGEKTSENMESAPISADEKRIEELRRKAMERMKLVGPGKSGEKHLRHELSRLGIDIGQALRDNLRNAKEPAPTSPTIGGKLKVKVPCRRQPDKVLRTILGQAYNARYMAFIKPGTPRSREIFDDVPSIADAFVGDQPAADDPEALPFSVNSGYRQVLEGQVMIHHTKADPGRPSNVHFSRSRRDAADPESAGTDDASAVDSDAVVSDDNTTVNGTAKTPGELLLEKAKDKFKNVKRTKENSDLWTCKYELRWTDLGQDHYPRYLREAICVHKKCWFGQFECRPKAFTVKVLKRWSDSCEITNEQYLNFVSSAGSGGSYDFSEKQHDHGDLTEEGIDHDVPPELQEKWVWEEIGVNFCCECTNIYA